MKSVVGQCATSLRCKPSGGRNWVGHLPLPRLCNSKVYMDFVQLPSYNSNNYALVMTDAVSRFVRVFPLNKESSGEEVAKLVWMEWCQVYGCHAALYSDHNARWGTENGWWMSLLR